MSLNLLAKYPVGPTLFESLHQFSVDLVRIICQYDSGQDQVRTELRDLTRALREPEIPPESHHCITNTTLWAGFWGFCPFFIGNYLHDQLEWSRRYHSNVRQAQGGKYGPDLELWNELRRQDTPWIVKPIA